MAKDQAGRFAFKLLCPEGFAISGKFAEQKVDFVKIDVEGFECKVFRGASKLLQQKPRIIQSEVWGTMQGCTPRQYVQLFMDAGYHLTRTSVF